MKRLIISAAFILSVPFFAGAQGDFPLDVLWRAETYVPADFSGKPLPTAGSRVTVTALTPTQNPRGLEYTWLVKDLSSSLPGADAKGVGLDTFSFTAESIIPNFIHEIEVFARNTLTGAVSSARVKIPVVKPELVLRPAGDITLSRGQSKNIFARPLYFNITRLGELVFRWFFNGQELAGGDRPDVLELRIGEETPVGADSRFRLQVENPGRARERAEAGFNVLIR